MQVIDRAFVRGLMPARDQGGHKGTFGKVYLLGGSVGYTGAPVLCAGGAVHSGCGLVFLGVPETVWPIAAARCLCAMPHPLAEQDGRLSAVAETEIRHRAAVCDAVAVGCGLGRSEGSDALVRALLTLEKPLVLDADGINALAGHIDTLSCRRGCVTVLTPHDGELARIGGDMTAPREAAAAASRGAVMSPPMRASSPSWGVSTVTQPRRQDNVSICPASAFMPSASSTSGFSNVSSARTSASLPSLRPRPQPTATASQTAARWRISVSATAESLPSCSASG